MSNLHARVPKILLFLLLIVLMTAAGVSCGKNTAVLEEYSSINYAVTDGKPVYGEVTNVVIFICFSNEDADAVSDKIDEDLIDIFEGEDNSLFDYYRDLSFGKIAVHSLFPSSGESCFVYKAPYARSHYAAVKKSASASKRYSEESSLLNGAIRAAQNYFSFGGRDLDVNDDGYVDSVTFLVSGGYDSSESGAWGGLLWPHSWELKKITSSGSPAKINGITVDRYSFNFIDSISVGVVSHEIGHVLGMPDLYHYDRDTGYLQVGQWDLMHSFCNTPQYTLTYLRAKYLDVLSEGAVVDLKKGGTYRLKPVTTAMETDVLAYRIVISDTESIWIEYRNKDASTYDSELTGSGIIVYRINSTASGNESGRYHSTYFPDEVYVYRPEIFGTGTRTNENRNLNVAYLNPSNENFSSLGGRDYSGKYNAKAIFLTNGVNTGIQVTADSVSAEEAIFTVDLNGYGTSEVSDIYVDGSPTINYGEDLNVRVKIKMKGSGTYVTADPKNYTVSYDPTLIGTQIATVTYRDEDNVDGVTCTFKLVVNDPIATDGVAIETPLDVTEIRVGESVDLTGLSLKVRYVSGATSTVTYSVNVATNWLTEGVDSTKSGSYYAKITYIPFDVHVYVVITVLSDLEAIEFVERNTSTLVDVNGSLSVNVIGRNVDGTTRNLTAEQYSLSLLDRTQLYVAQTLTATSNEVDASAIRGIIYVRAEDLTDVRVDRLPKTVYRYGESLDLSEGRVTFVFGEYSATASFENWFYLFDEGYRSTNRGRQTLTAEAFGWDLALDVTVLSPDSTVLTTNFDDVTVKNTDYVLFKNATSIERAERSFSSYLTIRFTYTDGDLTYAINSVTHDLLLDRNVRVELVNDEGRTVAKYRVFVFGDGNNDGRTDEEDLDSWATALFRNVSDVDLYLDFDGDGSYTLTDFAQLVEQYGGRG